MQKIGMYDKLSMILKYLERKQTEETTESKKK